MRIDCDPAAGTVTITDNGIGMTREEAIAEPRHDRALRHGGVLPRTLGGRPEGLRPHRPVRRGLLLGLHRRRAGRGALARPGCAPRTRCAGNPAPTGDFTVETIDAGCARHRGHAAPEGGRQGVRRPVPAARPSSAATPTTSASRCACARKARPRSSTRWSTRPRRCGRCRAPRSRTRSTASSTSTWRTTSPTRSPGATTASRASASTRASSTSPGAPRSTCGSAMPRGD